MNLKFEAPVPQSYDQAYGYNSGRECFWPGQLVTVPFPCPGASQHLYYALILRLYPVKPGNPHSPLSAELRLVDARRHEDRQKSLGVIWYAPLNELHPVRDAEELARYYLALGVYQRQEACHA